MTRGEWVVWGLEAGPGETASLHHPGLEDMLLFFPETLAILSDTGEPQGELTIEVQRGKYKDDIGILTHCLLVHASSRGFLDKSLCGSSLLGYLNNNLELMEQHSQEFIKFPVLPMERKMSVLKQDGQFVVTRSVKEGECSQCGAAESDGLAAVGAQWGSLPSLRLGGQALPLHLQIPGFPDNPSGQPAG